MKTIDSKLSQAYLHNVFTLSNTGELVWKVRSGTAKAGQTAGYIKKCGYRYVRLLNKDYPIHRVVWLYVHGVWPSGVIDHINGCKLDNRPANLRDVQPLENMSNMKIRSNSGYLGVYAHYSSARDVTYYSFQVTHKGKTIRQSGFSTAYEAALARKKVLMDLGFDDIPLQSPRGVQKNTLPYTYDRKTDQDESEDQLRCDHQLKSDDERIDNAEVETDVTVDELENVAGWLKQLATIA